MKILITGDISDWNIKDFSLHKLNPAYLDLIKKHDLVVYNLEGPIVDRHNKFLEFRESFFRRFFLYLLNSINNLIKGKSHPYVSSTNAIVQLLSVNGNTLVTLANNHIKDYGKSGFMHTLEILEKNNINYIGAGININYCKDFQFKNIVIINVNLVGAKKAGFFHLHKATKNDFGTNYIPINLLGRKIKNLKSDSKKVVLIIHAGKELAHCAYELGLNLDSIKNMQADVTVIHHPHIYLKTDYEDHNIFILGDFVFKSADDRLREDRETACLKIEFKYGKIFTALVKCKANECYKYE
jgi:hypothetical protein